MSRFCLSLVILVIVLFGAVGCRSTIVEAERTPAATDMVDPNATPTPTRLFVTSTKRPPVVIMPYKDTSTPQGTESSPPTIHSVQFTTDPESGIGETVFQHGIEEIWAVMEYSGMREGLTFKRVWYLDGVIWREREDPWDFARYGEAGTLKDVSIFDHEEGLPMGRYDLVIQIDTKYQLSAPGRLEFTFEIIGTKVYPSPSGAQTVLLEQPGTLRLACELCDDDPLAEHPEIDDVLWFPDEQHVLYVTVDRSNQPAGMHTLGAEWDLWIVNIDGTPPYRITEDYETLIKPVISPDSRFIAVHRGSGFCDGGMCASGLGFIKLEDYQRTDTVDAGEFAGPLFDMTTYLLVWSGTPNYTQLGEWVSATEFIAPIQFVGASGPEYNPGMYRFNLSTLTAERIGDLPK